MDKPSTTYRVIERPGKFHRFVVQVYYWPSEWVDLVKCGTLDDAKDYIESQRTKPPKVVHGPVHIPQE